MLCNSMQVVKKLAKIVKLNLTNSKHERNNRQLLFFFGASIRNRLILGIICCTYFLFLCCYRSQCQTFVSFVIVAGRS